ncbi:glycosyltransferase, partial [Candidatus Curtissbacteria bacterium]|nr:glycosyltransferase [Candidatus Curtissbacteria bacterium]
VASVCPTPTLMTWHGPYDDQITHLFATLSKPYLVSISDSQRQKVPYLNFVGTVYNGLDMASYPFSARDQGYLLYVGRIDPDKGVHFAMDTAIKLNRKLILAAKLDNKIPHLKKYFQRYIKPRLEKYPHLLKWIGEVNEKQRNTLMSHALCFLHPVTWQEPFGLTLIEAMACGCPVVAFNNGSIPEIIKNGKTGYVVENLKEMVNAVKNIEKIKRIDCRNHSLQNFNSQKMAQGYEDVYYQILNRTKQQTQFSSLPTSAVLTNHSQPTTNL